MLSLLLYVVSLEVYTLYPKKGRMRLPGCPFVEEVGFVLLIHINMVEHGGEILKY